MKGYAETQLENTARESFRCCKICTFDRLINIFTILMCLVSIFVCYFIAKTAEEKYNNNIISLQSRLSALELQLHLESKVEINKKKREIRSSSGSHENSVRVALLANLRQKRNTKKKKPSETKSRRNAKRKNTKMLAIQVEGPGGIQPGYNGNNQHGSSTRFAGTFSKWKYADFISSALTRKRDKKQFEKRFKLDPESGKMVVKRKGIYLLYAQITLIGHGNVGYLVKVGKKDDPILTCWSNMDNDSSTGNLSSCTTIGLVSLDKNSEVYIQHADTQNGKALFNSNSSFFGLVHISD